MFDGRDLVRRVALLLLLACLVGGCASLALMDQLERGERERARRARMDEQCRTECVETPAAPECRRQCPGQWEAVESCKGRKQ